MTAGTEAADKKNISKYEEATLHSIPLCKEQCQLNLYRDKKKKRLNKKLDAGFCELKIQVIT